MIAVNIIIYVVIKNRISNLNAYLCFDISYVKSIIALLEKCSLLGYYAVSSGKGLLGSSIQGFLTPEDGTEWLSRNVGKRLALLPA